MDLEPSPHPTFLTRSYNLQVLTSVSEGSLPTGGTLKVEVTLSGSIQPPSEWVISRQQMDQWVHSNLIEPLKNSVIGPTWLLQQPENLALSFYKRLHGAPQGTHLVRVLVRTSKNLFATAP